MTRAFFTVAALGLAAGLTSALAAGCSCENLRANTQVMATIDAEPGVRAMARRLVGRVYGAPADQAGVPDVLVQEFPFPVAAAEGWPVTVALAPRDRDPSRRYRLEAIAQTQSGGEVATVRAISGYAEGQTLWLRLLLLDGCIGVTCEDPGQTCIGPEQCEDATVDPEDLPPYEVDAGISDDGGAGDAGGCSPETCDDGLECTEDSCDAQGRCTHTPRDAMCDDGNPCTDDACTGEGGDASGCSYVANTLPCDDGVFCNGLDTCSDGECVHAGDPCGSPLICEEVSGRCLGCTTTADCPGPMEGSFGACTGATACATSGTRSRTMRTFECMVGACVPVDTTESQACTRVTDGDACSDGNDCTSPDHCSGGACVGGANVCMDAGVDGGWEASADAGWDAGRDAGVDASGTAGRDAGWDGGCDSTIGSCDECQVDSDCDDFNPCTEDTCVRLPPHYCTHTPVACADGSVARIDGGIMIP